MTAAGSQYNGEQSVILKYKTIKQLLYINLAIKPLDDPKFVKKSFIRNFDSKICYLVYVILQYYFIINNFCFSNNHLDFL